MPWPGSIFLIGRDDLMFVIIPATHGNGSIEEYRGTLTVHDLGSERRRQNRLMVIIRRNQLDLFLIPVPLPKRTPDHHHREYNADNSDLKRELKSLRKPKHPGTLSREHGGENQRLT